ncbi:CHAT domain-containing protein [Fusarium sp. MPI-SDFR-AT-0072]|nr:CHAT domain-containing protein [Fusarium sp. MPI-SDFR-AT-0072]
MLSNPVAISKRISKSTKAVIFLGTPHRGSKWTGISRLEAILLQGVRSNPKILSPLDYDSDELRDLDRDFESLTRDGLLEINCWERRPVRYCMLWLYPIEIFIVSESSAAHRGRCVPLDAHHFQLNKFGSRDDGIYSNVCREILEGIKFAKSKPENSRAPENAYTKMTKEQMECLQVFRLDDYQWYKDRVDDLVEGTCQWFLKQPNFQKWSQGDFGPLLVSADPGCGKSVLAKFLVDFQLPRSATSAAICYFFFKDQDQDTAKQALCALLHQLFSKKPSLIKHAMPEFAKNGEKLVNIPTTLWDILESATLDPEAGQVIFVLDALDECANNERNTLTGRLERLFSSKNEKGGKLKILLTSRPYDKVVSPFRRLEKLYPHLRIPGEDESEDISQEVNVVIKYRVNQLAMGAEIRDHLEQRLSEIKHRTYLWLYLVLDYLQSFRFERTEEGVDSIMRNLPETVEEAYEKILSKPETNEGQKEVQKKIRKALCIILAANRPLTLKEMNTALKITTKSKSINGLRLEHDKDFKDTLREWCGLFVSIYDGKVYFLHQTAREFLLQKSSSPATIPALPGLWQHSIGFREAHAVLMETCRIYLVLAVLEYDGQFASSEEVHQYANGYAFLRYSARYWALHFRESRAQNEALSQPILETAKNKNLSRRLNILSTTLGDCYQRWGNMDALWIASGVAELAVSAIPEDHPDSAGHLHTLAIQLYRRYKRISSMDDLNRAVEAADRAVESTLSDHPNRAGRLNTLGNLLGTRFARTGAIVDLEEAIRVTQMAVEAAPEDHPDQAELLSNLGLRLGDRYLRTGEMVDLKEAIRVAQVAIDLTPDDHPDRAELLSNLGLRLGDRYLRTGEMVDLEEAIHMTRVAIEATPEDHPDRAELLSNLGLRLGDRYLRTGEMVDLEEAIHVTRVAIEATPEDHPDRAELLSNLGLRLGDRYLRTGEMVDLEEAIRVARVAVEDTPDDHPNLAVRLNNLGTKLESLYERTGEISHLDEASLTLQDAWHCQTAIPFHRVQAGARCLKLLALQHKTDIAIALGKSVIDLLPKVNARLLDRNDQQFVVSTFGGVATDLCAFLLQSNQPADALRYLEKGRAVIIGQLMDARSDLSILEHQHPDIARRYQRLRDEVNSPVRQVGQDVVQAQSRTRRLQALAELDVCIQHIRNIAGHELFMLGQEPSEMQKCATEGSIVIVNITAFRSDAIIVSSTAINTLNLSRLAFKDATAWLGKNWTGRRSELRRKNWEYLDYLSWLWETCVKQIIDEVCHSHNTENSLPRIWWIGAGLASSMPFHAAGIHSSTSAENAFSRVVSSYTPSIRALAYAQYRARATESAQGPVLIATMPTTPGSCSDLPGTKEEKNQLIGAVDGHLPIKHLELPNVEDVIRSLRNCCIAHFACHGFMDHVDPSKSGLIFQLRGEQDRLTVQTVSELRLRNAQIVYLSACSTAENRAAQLSDEVIHLVSGFQVGGFPHAIGCFWPANESVCVEVANRFYLFLFEHGRTVWGGREVASALHDAVMEVRKTNMRTPLTWAQFVHFGM